MGSVRSSGVAGVQELQNGKAANAEGFRCLLPYRKTRPKNRLLIL